MEQVLREEKKFLLTTEEAVFYAGQLAQVMAADSHNGTGGYLIRSLYFDTLVDGDYFDKVDGLEVRRKLRLRCYSADAPYAMLEMKQKQGVQQRKRSLRVKREDAQRLCAGDYGPLLQYGSDFAAECCALMQMRCYRPKVVVDYRRTAFVAKENSIRITFDRDVRATEGRYDIFDPGLCLYPVMDPSLVVMEVKYNNFLLSYIKRMVDRIDRRELSIGKYSRGRDVSYGLDF